MSDELTRGTRVKIQRGAYTNRTATIVKVNEDDSLLAFVDGVEEIEDFYPNEVEVFTQPDVKMIHTTGHLFELKNELGVRDDWHEPEEMGVSVEIRGKSFDNAGFWGHGRTDLIGKSHEELHVVLKVDNEPVAMVNLATLFAFATGYEG